MLTAVAVSQPTNGAKESIDLSIPFIANITIEGTADLLFHAWNCEAVDEKSKARKGSAAKKEDNLESYVYRNTDGVLCLPSEYLRMSIINAAKFRQDPRSPRKSAMDLFKAGIVGLEPLCPLTSIKGCAADTWDYLHRCRVQIQRNGVTRVRPALTKGWKVQIPILCNLPEYIDPPLLNDVIQAAGRLVGVADFRPTYGRFIVTNFEVQES